jgi:hypothetical protein
MAGALAGPVTVLALLVSAPPARAQCDPLTEQAAFGLTIDMEEKVFQLEKIKRQIEVEHDILMIYPGGAGLVGADAAAGLFSHAILLGEMHPDSAISLVREMRQATNYYLHQVIEPDLADAKACLEKLKRGPQPPPPPGPTSAAATPIDWPAPMNWLAVKGIVGGSYVAECTGGSNNYHPPIRRAGPFRLEFLGDGRVSALLGDDQREYRGIGTINASGLASGEAQSGNPEHAGFHWEAQFQRVGIDLQMSSQKLDLTAASRGTQSILVDCKPGYMRMQ